MNNNIPQVTNLIFSGGGAAGIAFAGAVEQLCKEPGFSLDGIENVAGTSIGSIAALLVSLKYPVDQIMQLLTSINLTRLADGGWLGGKVVRLYSEYGVYKGEELYNLILGFIKTKTGRADPENVTFADLKKMGCRNLFVVATRLYTLNGIPTGKRKVFSTEKTPRTSVAAAVLASCAAPFYFERVRLKKIAKGEYVLSDDGELYNDGGVMNNLALELFDKGVLNPHSLGLAILPTGEIVDPWHIPQKGRIADSSPVVWGEALFNAAISRNKMDGLEKSKYHERVVQIDRLGVGLAAFDMDEKTRMALIDSGRVAVERYFEVLRNQEAYARPKLKLVPKPDSFAGHKVPNGQLWKEKANDDKFVSTVKPTIVFVER